nr:HWE histidine kinase domain-containing protein [Sulfitobacter aestuariivivens]
MEDFPNHSDTYFDLNTCDLEPIHTPGRIQPFGVLLAGPANLSTISHCSENTTEYLNTDPKGILGNSFKQILGHQLVHDLRNLASMSTIKKQRQRAGLYTIDQGSFEVYLHVNPEHMAVVELEPAKDHDPRSGQSAIDEMQKYLAATDPNQDIPKLLDRCVVGLAALTGFDRVMAYRYEPNGDGQIVAESRGPDVTSFLGLRYPAWDVPEQARALQVKCPVRMLVDVNQTPIAILSHEKDAAPLDISLAHLRGISPIHVEYLSNMGVAATMTIGLVVEGRLWGMFSCHHESPKIVSSDIRIAAELFGLIISLLIKQRIDLEKSMRRHQAADASKRIVAETDATTDLLNSFPNLAPILMSVIACDGLAIKYDGKTLTHGSTPSDDAINAISKHDIDNEDVVNAWSNLAQCNLINGEDLGHSAGALLVRATAAYPLQLFFFRDEKIRSVDWAGKPEKTMEPGPLGPRITPRGSFDAYVEEHRGTSDPWEEPDLAAAQEVQILLTQISAKGERLQLMRHKDLVTHQRQQDLMIAELNHRVKNILALIRSLSRQAKASSASLESYALALEQRIAALAAAHDLAVSNTMKGVSLRGILKTELAPYLSADNSQVLLAGPLVGLRADVAPIIALVLHEVVSNAVKYGALSVDDGVVRAKWSLEGDRLRFNWQEINGPRVAEPTRHGFGRSLIEKAIPYEMDGDAQLEFDEAGLKFSFGLPSDVLVELHEETSSKLVGTVATIDRAASGKSILLVEDNVVLAMDMVESISRLGAETVETASSLSQGLALAQKTDYDFAVLDMNLRGTVSFEIALLLKKRGIPFAFATGYGSQVELPVELRSTPILTKPIDDGTLSKCIQDHIRK